MKLNRINVNAVLKGPRRSPTEVTGESYIKCQVLARCATIGLLPEHLVIGEPTVSSSPLGNTSVAVQSTPEAPFQVNQTFYYNRAMVRPADVEFITNSPFLEGVTDSVGFYREADKHIQPWFKRRDFGDFQVTVDGAQLTTQPGSYFYVPGQVVQLGMPIAFRAGPRGNNYRNLAVATDNYPNPLLGNGQAVEFTYSASTDNTAKMAGFFVDDAATPADRKFSTKDIITVEMTGRVTTFGNEPLFRISDSAVVGLTGFQVGLFKYTGDATITNLSISQTNAEGGGGTRQIVLDSNIANDPFYVKGTFDRTTGTVRVEVWTSIDADVVQNDTNKVFDQTIDVYQYESWNRVSFHGKVGTSGRGTSYGALTTTNYVIKYGNKAV